MSSKSPGFLAVTSAYEAFLHLGAHKRVCIGLHGDVWGCTRMHKVLVLPTLAGPHNNYQGLFQGPLSVEILTSTLTTPYYFVLGLCYSGAGGLERNSSSRAGKANSKDAGTPGNGLPHPDGLLDSLSPSSYHY